MYKFLISLIVHPKSKFSARSQIRRFFLHIPVGLFIVLGAVVCWPTAFCLTYLFWCYEMNEDQKLSDSAWLDVRGAIGGLFIGIGVLAVI